MRAAVVALITPAAEVLVLRRSSSSSQGGTWGLPGGHVEPGEGKLEATIREVAEETGYNLTAPLTYITDNDDVVFYKSYVERFTPTLNSEHTNAIWATLGNLPGPLFPGLLELLTNIMTTKRIPDGNGWIEVSDNPISKVGVFPYSGRAIGAPDPNKMYNVYRPAEELNNPETIESFKLLPFVDEHPLDMLGAEEDDLPTVDGKPAEGVIGERVYFSNDYLYANLKFFTDRVAQALNAGKKEVSAGFRCMYEKASGVFNGQPYDYIQRNIRGNHVALVTQGRMGPEVAVLDHFKLTFDSKELIQMTTKTAVKKAGTAKDAEGEGEMTLSQITEVLKVVGPQLAAINKAMASLTSAEAPAEVVDADAEVVDEDASPTATEAPAAAEDTDPATPAAAEDEDPAPAMDAMEKRIVASVLKAIGKPAKALDAKDVMQSIAGRDRLYQGVSRLIGAFDHAEMTEQDVAKYAVKKLNIQGVPAGHESIAVQGYLAAKAPAPAKALDSKETTASPIATHFQPKTAE